MSRRNPDKRKRPATITVPDRVGPHVRLLFTEMRRQNVTYDEVEEGSGVRRAALKAWRHKNRPSLESIEAALGFLGFDLVPIPRAKVLPAEIVAEIREVAARLDLDMPATVKLIVEVVAGIHARFGEVATDEAPTVAEAPPRRRSRLFPHPDQCSLLEIANVVH
ncbi:hypothetical protein [Methylobacterium sp. WCS2018Hpa-22]|uniref:hypothetical protein n=1 Tax=Methylobacterium sp. WCS2018Hpa-22 TaxID=3073633 RepID=UPI00288AE4CF|nr:hypothetical protein [Methylobacterium sp. WCS2018Hpa-22]